MSFFNFVNKDKVLKIPTNTSHLHFMLIKLKIKWQLQQNGTIPKQHCKAGGTRGDVLSQYLVGTSTSQKANYNDFAQFQVISWNFR